MIPDTSSLIAALVAVCAVLVACVAVGIVLLAGRMRRRLGVARERFVQTTAALRRDGPRVRHLLARIEADLDRVQRQDAAMDRRLVGMTSSLVPIRQSIEGITRGRLAVLIRGAGVVSKAAQFALLWR